MTTETLRLERETCSRCGGSGNYSYCQRYGTVCFKCGGKKEVLTKRGAAAMQYLKGLRSRPAGEVKPGDQIKYDAITLGGTPFTAWFTVQSVGPDATVCRSFVNGVEQPVRSDLLTFDLTSKTAGPLRASGITPEKPIEVLLSKEEQVETLRQAIAYQDTLTKSGTPRKRPAR